jgi:hypothetical protein
VPEGWDWDESLFAGSYVFYDRGRIPYPPGLRDAFADAANLRGSPRLSTWVAALARWRCG